MCQLRSEIRQRDQCGRGSSKHQLRTLGASRMICGQVTKNHPHPHPTNIIPLLSIEHRDFLVLRILDWPLVYWFRWTMPLVTMIHHHTSSHLYSWFVMSNRYKIGCCLTHWLIWCMIWLNWYNISLCATVFVIATVSMWCCGLTRDEEDKTWSQTWTSDQNETKSSSEFKSRIWNLYLTQGLNQTIPNHSWEVRL